MAVVVGFLVISFAIWGVGDVFRGFGRSTVAKIGRTEITIDAFRTLYNDRLQQFSRQLGRSISPAQARALGLDRLVIAQLIADVALDERARVLGLNLSEAEVAKHVTSDPAFQGPNGQFDHARFEAIIRQAGYTEARFLAEQRRRLLRRQIAGTMTGGLTAPKAALEATNRYQNEQRSIDYLLLDHAQAGEISEPTPEVLAKYYEERKALFRAPEYRKFTFVVLIPTEQARWIEISDQDARRAYDERRARFITPERRHIQQIDFPNMDAARAAADRIAKGTSFVEIAKELGKTEKDIDLGTVPKSGVIDKAVAEAAFALKEGEVSAPVQGRFGPVLVQVLKIEPEVVRKFEEVAGEIKRELALERAKAQMLTVYDKIEDARADGKSLAEAAANLKIESRTIEAVDRSGRDPSGEPVSGIPEARQLLPAVFSTDVGVDRDPLRVEGGYIWYEVNDITRSRERPLDEVKEQVATRWREQEIAARLKAKAAELVDKLKAGTSLADVAAAAGLKVTSAAGLKRSDAPAPLSAAAVDAAFRAPKDGVGSADAAQAGEQIVFSVTDIIVPTLDLASAEAKQALETLNRTLSENVFAEYVTYLEGEIGVTINQTALNQVISGGASTDN
jgi:peptidyl-prolyl cis-trans isomerase D